ncbi:hypothetical protein NC653_004914 [Populus alba x Populus x berolinensis]|nr:hypothetical protein NC653_004914 [Populus alba x Populus x berolinensis]
MAAILAAYFPPEFLVLGACCELRLKERFRRCLWSISSNLTVLD